jgi:hypothetical protein
VGILIFMPFFINQFDTEFVGVLVLEDRQLSYNFRVKGNSTSGTTVFMAHASETWNMTGNTILTVNYSFDSGQTYTRYSFDCTVGAVNIAAVQAAEIANAMNADATFSALFTASVTQDKTGANWVLFKSQHKREQWRCYLMNTGAESVLRFNYNAGVAELPTYFRRHALPTNFSGAITAATNVSPIAITSANHGLVTGRVIVVSGVGGNTAANGTWSITNTGTNTFTLDGSVGNGAYTSSTGGWTVYFTPDSNKLLIELNTTVASDQQIITNAKLNYNIVQTDWQLLAGRSGMFTFQKLTVDTSDRITQIIEYQAGASVGDFGRKTTYVYTSTNTHPSQVAEVPYTLTSADLITP